MAWVFDSVVDSGRDPDQANGRKVYYARVLFINGNNSQCLTTFFYDTVPTNQQKIDRVQTLLNSLNNIPPPDITDEVINSIKDILRDYAIRTGKTKNQIITAIQNGLT